MLLANSVIFVIQKIIVSDFGYASSIHMLFQIFCKAHFGVDKRTFSVCILGHLNRAGGLVLDRFSVR